MNGTAVDGTIDASRACRRLGLPCTSDTAWSTLTDRVTAFDNYLERSNFVTDNRVATCYRVQLLECRAVSDRWLGGVEDGCVQKVGL